NPFQQNARTAAAFFVADSEERSELLLEALPAVGGEDVSELTDDELAELADERTAQQEREEMRYVMIDDAMAAGKFPAMATWAGSDYESYLDQREIEIDDGGTATVRGLGEGYEETTLSRLYYDDAAGMENYRLVHESPETTQFVSVAVQGGDGEWMTLATNREFSFELQFYLQCLIEDPTLDVETVQLFDEREASGVKTYERVEGATLAGEAEPGETVTAQLELTAASSERTFTYTQETAASEDGSYELTVPYATSEDLGTEDGYTDSDVIAEGDYEIRAGGETATAAVSEEAIYDGETVSVDTVLEGGGEETEGDGDGAESEEDETEGDEVDDADGADGTDEVAGGESGDENEDDAGADSAA
ncbi:MAG: hypothetical protein QXG03_08050, partial [Halalkalicoccus sp.]